MQFQGCLRFAFMLGYRTHVICIIVLRSGLVGMRIHGVRYGSSEYECQELGLGRLGWRSGMQGCFE